MLVLGPEEVRQKAPLPADWPSATAALVDQAQRTLDAIDGVEGIAVSGGPREELTKLAEDVDLLIVGIRGYGPWAACCTAASQAIWSVTCRARC